MSAPRLHVGALSLSRENGRSITVNDSLAPRDGVDVIVWRKNQGPLLTLDLTEQEAVSLLRMLDGALARAALTKAGV